MRRAGGLTWISYWVRRCKSSTLEFRAMGPTRVSRDARGLGGGAGDDEWLDFERVRPGSRAEGDDSSCGILSEKNGTWESDLASDRYQKNPARGRLRGIMWTHPTVYGRYIQRISSCPVASMPRQGMLRSAKQPLGRNLCRRPPDVPATKGLGQ